MLLDVGDSTADNASPHLSPDGRVIYFASDRIGTLGNTDLWIAERASLADPFGEAVPLVELNSSAREISPWVSPDGRVIYFVSTRGGVSALYVASR